MVLIALIKEAFAALWANRLRSFLTLLGMVMGVTSVITIVSTVEGMQNNIEDALASLGPKTFIVTRFGVGLSMTAYEISAAIESALIVVSKPALTRVFFSWKSKSVVR